MEAGSSLMLARNLDELTAAVLSPHLCPLVERKLQEAMWGGGVEEVFVRERLSWGQVGGCDLSCSHLVLREEELGVGFGDDSRVS
jgi:hypothetical protein